VPRDALGGIHVLGARENCSLGGRLVLPALIHDFMVESGLWLFASGLGAGVGELRRPVSQMGALAPAALGVIIPEKEQS